MPKHKQKVVLKMWRKYLQIEVIWRPTRNKDGDNVKSLEKKSKHLFILLLKGGYKTWTIYRVIGYIYSIKFSMQNPLSYLTWCQRYLNTRKMAKVLEVQFFHGCCHVRFCMLSLIGQLKYDP